jgi:HEAT repeat protein
MITDLIEKLKDDDKDVRSFAALQLKNIGDEAAIKPLISGLNDPDPEVRLSVVHSLSVLGFNLGKKCVLKYVLHALNDTDAEVRKESAMALGTWLLNFIDDKGVTQMLIERLKDPENDVSDRVAFTLGNLYDKKKNYDVVWPIIDALEDDDPVIKEKVNGILLKRIKIKIDKK